MGGMTKAGDGTNGGTGRGPDRPPGHQPPPPPPPAPPGRGVIADGGVCAKAAYIAVLGPAGTGPAGREGRTCEAEGAAEAGFRVALAAPAEGSCGRTFNGQMVKK